jgi:tetratricopeptide (TPR) repeat protein
VRPVRTALAAWALARAGKTEGPAAERWYGRAARWNPAFSPAHEELIRRLLAREARPEALAAAQHATQRHAGTSDAWVLLGAVYRSIYRTRDALVAYEQALMLDERADAAMAAGLLYRQLGDWQTAGARFARAFAAGAGPDALKANAEMLRKTGDLAAADAAEARWREETGGP